YISVKDKCVAKLAFVIRYGAFNLELISLGNAKSACPRRSNLANADSRLRVSRHPFSAIRSRQSRGPAGQSGMVKRTFRQESAGWNCPNARNHNHHRSEEHTSELQSR